VTHTYPGGLQLSDTIYPSTDLDAVLRLNQVERDGSHARLSSAGTGHSTLFTVPSGKRWRLYVLSFDRISGDATVSNLSVLDVSSNQACVIGRQSAAGFGTFNGSPYWMLDQLDQVRFYVGSISSNSVFEVTSLIEEEDFY